MILNINEEYNKLDKNEPDYIIEDFWIGIKISMINYYNNQNILYKSNILNNYKKEHKYKLIEKQIRDYIIEYIYDIFKNEKSDNYIHSDILFSNIKRWNKISNIFYPESSINKTDIYYLFCIYHHIKKKYKNKFNNILNLFKNINSLYENEFELLVYYGFKFNIINILLNIENIIGYNKVIKHIINNFNIKIENKHKKISYIKLIKLYYKN